MARQTGPRRLRSSHVLAQQGDGPGTTTRKQQHLETTEAKGHTAMALVAWFPHAEETRWERTQLSVFHRRVSWRRGEVRGIVRWRGFQSGRAQNMEAMGSLRVWEWMA